MNAAGRPAPTASRPQTQPSKAVLFGCLLVVLLAQVMQVSGGICWESMERNGKCKELLEQRVTMEECCSANQPAGAAWYADDMDPGALFFWRNLGEGVPCTACRESCSGMQCGAGRRCALRRGRPRCVCAPQCGGSSGGSGGPVCGTDGRSYRSLCRLRKRACRRRTRDLALDYNGHCQSSCVNVRCGAGKHCLVDQDERAHCVRCSRSCPRQSTGLDSHDGKPLCGADAKTYPSACHLRAAACRAGRSIPIAYRGPCKPGATCDTVRCKPHQECLSDPQTGAPRCVTCRARCPRAPRPRRALCATNNRTYVSWCHMVRDSCVTGFIIDTRHAGACGSVNLGNLNSIAHDEDKEDDESNTSS